MKRNLLYTMALALIIGASANAQSRFVPEDDIYYQPKESNPIVEKKKNEKKNNIIVVTDETPAEITIKTSSNNKVLRELDEDEYNRRGSAYLDEITQEVFDDPDIEEATYVNPNEGYYLNEFNGTSSDYEYAERIRKFHNPKFTIHISDPQYTDIYFLNSSDWNVYVDNSYAWITPTWTNPYYHNYMWAPYSYSSLSWRWNFGYASWGMSWGWGRPGFYDPWYCGGYRPYHHHYPHYAHHYPGYNHGWGGGYYPSHRPNNRVVYGSRSNRPTTATSSRPTSSRNVSTVNRNTRPSTTRSDGGRNNNISTRPSGNVSNQRPGNSSTTSRPSSSNSQTTSSRKEGTTTQRADGSSVRTESTRPSGTTGTTRSSSSSSESVTTRSRSNSSSSSSRSESSYSSGSSTSSRSSGSSSTRSSSSSSSGSSRSSGSSGSSSRGGTRR